MEVAGFDSTQKRRSRGEDPPPRLAPRVDELVSEAGGGRAFRNGGRARGGRR